MSLRWKIALAMAAIVSVATIAVGTAGYRSTRDRLLAEVDRSLTDVQGLVTDRRVLLDPLPERGPLSGFDAQVIRSDGSVGQSTFVEPLPVSDEDRELLGRARVARFATVETAAGDYRVRTIGLPRGAIQIGRPLEETERVLAGLRGRTVLWVLVVAAASIAAGLWIAGRVTASLRRLTDAAEHVGATGRLDLRVGDDGDDEVGRLATAFDRMLVALARSRDEQHRLVQDAGHELRTPLTSLRTNLDALRRYPAMGTADRDAIVDDLRAETEELTELVDEIIAVASGDTSDEPVVPFDLGEVAAEVATRFERRSGRSIVVDVAPSPVVAQRSGVQRAISCLLDNACKFDTTGGPIELVVRDATVTVSDRGPGIPTDELERVFDRFHRAEEARAMPGSGLGLSIVRQVAQRHGGDADARPRVGGGTEVSFRVGAGAPWPAPGS